MQKGGMLWFYLCLVTWNLIVSLDSTALSTALPTIAEELHATSNQAFWAGTSYVLCSAAFQPIFSSFSDSFGRKPIILVAIILFTIGTILSGIAHDISILLVGRCIQGCGGGGLLAISYVLMADELRLHDRHKAISTLSVTWLIGTVTGPIISGAFTQTVSWRWIFWINLPLCGISLALLFMLQCSFKPLYSGWERIKNIDFLGAAMFVSSLTVFLVALSWAGTMYAWKDAATIAPLVLGACGIAFWVFYSIKLTSKPLIPFTIMDSYTSIISYFGNIGHGIVFFGLLYYLPLYYQAVLGYSPIIAGVACLPQCATAGPFAAITGALIARTRRIKPFAVFGWGLLALGAGLVGLLSTTSKPVHWIFLNLPSGIALGVLFASLALSTQSACEAEGKRTPEEVEKLKGIAASLNPFFRGIGQTLGIVLGQAAFMNEVARKAGNTVPTKDAMALAEIIKHLPKESPQHMALVQGYNDSLKPVWYVLVGVAGLFLVLSVFTRDSTTSSTRTKSISSDAESSICSAAVEIVMEKGSRPRVVTTPPLTTLPTATPSRRPSLFGRTAVFMDGVQFGFAAFGASEINRRDSLPASPTSRRSSSQAGVESAYATRENHRASIVKMVETISEISSYRTQTSSDEKHGYNSWISEDGESISGDSVYHTPYPERED